MLFRSSRLVKSLMGNSGLASVRPSVRLSVCNVGILTVTHQGAACDVTTVHFGPTIRRTDILASNVFLHCYLYSFCRVTLC